MIGTIHKIPVNHIFYDEKATVVPSAVDMLLESIISNGLLHPITVVGSVNLQAQFTGQRFKLVAGLHRLLAHKKGKINEIDALVVPGNLTDDEIMEIHTHENLKRQNLPWYESVILEKQLHELRQRQKGKGQRGAKSGWSLRDTAEELQQSLGTVSQDINLADAVLADPTLRNIMDKTTALRLIKSGIKRISRESEAGVAVSIIHDLCYLGEASAVLKRIPDSTFDACITDPPWLMYERDEELRYDKETLPVFKEIYRVLKHDSFMYLFVGAPDFALYQVELPKLGFKVQVFPLVWVKLNTITMGRRGWEYARDHELILVAVKGNPVMTRQKEYSSIFTWAVVPPMHLLHPNEKPVEIIKEILRHCTYPGSLILDSFAGSGAVLDAAKIESRRFIGIEREKKYYDKIVKRIGQDDD